jgi:hypothetical protein
VLLGHKPEIHQTARRNIRSMGAPWPWSLSNCTKQLHQMAAPLETVVGATQCQALAHHGFTGPRQGFVVRCAVRHRCRQRSHRAHRRRVVDGR